MTPIRYVALAALGLAFVAAPAMAKEDSVAVVNGKAIPAARANAIVGAQVAQGQPDTAQLRNAVRDFLIRREVVVQAAQKMGLDKKPEVRTQIDYARQEVLVGTYVSDYVSKHPVTEEAVRKDYEAFRALKGDKEYKVRHILVESEDEAKAIIEKLKKGEKFGDLAKQSKDPGSKDKGGELDWAAPDDYVPPFSAAMVKLAKGSFTEVPVKTAYGYHVLMLDDTRELKAPGFDEVKGQLAQRLQQRMVEQHIAELRAKAKVD